MRAWTRDTLYTNAFLLDTLGKESHFQKPGPRRKKRNCSFSAGMWNFAGDLLEFFPKLELPK